MSPISTVEHMDSKKGWIFTMANRVTEYAIYCPVCGKTIEPDNVREVESGEDDSFIYIHDNITHYDSDLIALENGLH